jgi:hypothetical protein
MNLTEFPEHVFPESVTKYVHALERSGGLIPDLLYPAGLAAFSGMIGASVCTNISTGWTVYPSLWIATIGHSGIKKSPNIGSMLRVNRIIDNKNFELFEASLKEYNSLNTEEKNSVNRPFHKRISLSDATFEAIQAELYKNQLGLTVDKDEILGFFSDLNKYRPSGNEEALLSIYSNLPIDVVRKSSEPIRIKKPFLTMIGGIQIKRLKNLLTADRFASGFASRILYSFPQGLIVKRGDRSEFKVELEEYEALCYRLYKLRENCEKRSGSPIELKLAPNAMITYNNWVDQFVDTKRNEPSERDAVKSYVSKLEETCIRIATILESVWSAHYKREPECISDQILGFAIEITENYFFAHFTRVLAVLEESTESIGNEFFLRQFYNRFKKDIPREEERAFIMGLVAQNFSQKQICETFSLPKSTLSTWKKTAFS